MKYFFLQIAQFHAVKDLILPSHCVFLQIFNWATASYTKPTCMNKLNFFSMSTHMCINIKFFIDHVCITLKSKKKALFTSSWFQLLNYKLLFDHSKIRPALKHIMRIKKILDNKNSQWEQTLFTLYTRTYRFTRVWYSIKNWSVMCIKK